MQHIVVLVFNCKARLGCTAVLWGGVGVWGKGSGVAPPLFSFVVQRNVFLIVISYAVVEEVIVVVLVVLVVVAAVVIVLMVLRMEMVGR